MKILKYISIIVIIITNLLVVSCSNDKSSDEPLSESIVVTGDVVEVNMVSAVVSGKINLSKLVGTNYSVGIVYCTQDKYSSLGELTVSNCQYVTAKDIIDNTFTVELTRLQKGEKYYYSAYVYLNGIYYYGKSFTFKTKSITKELAVDLGLSVKWASVNLGAESSDNSSFGDYYYWAETKKLEKDQYNSMPGRLIGYDDINSLIDANVIDEKFRLTSKFDAATVNWGGQWRMPTKEEWVELIDKCKWEWSDLKGTKGYLVSRNGNSIFLPASSLQYYKYNDIDMYIDPETGDRLFLPFTNNESYIDFPLGAKAFPELGFYASSSCCEDAEAWADPDRQVLGYRYPYFTIFGNKDKSLVSGIYSYVIGYFSAFSVRPVYCGK